MIPRDSVPVLSLLSSDLDLLPDTVNFLRCGCKKVQWMVNTNCFESNQFMNSHHLLNRVEDTLAALQVAGEETFKIEAPMEWMEGTVITFTRHTPAV
ncbi:hypothetical protein KW791_04110 [Candidatus Parcubacteria bacterium]|nr:hypothetical protein [Candidatus Parcubacteria bacterium]